MGVAFFFVEVSSMQDIYLELFWNNFLQEQRLVVFFHRSKADAFSSATCSKFDGWPFE